MKNLALLLGAASVSALQMDIQQLSVPEMVKETQVAKNGVWIPERYATGDDDQLMKQLIEEGLAYTKDKDFDPKY